MFAGMNQMKKQGRMLIVSATEDEIEQTVKWVAENHHSVSFCITEPGVPAVVFNLTRHLMNENYSLVINAGIAGCFNDGIQTGEVVEAVSDCFADLGAEDGEEFIHISEMGFNMQAEAFKNYFFPVSALPVIDSGLRKVKSITVNKVHGHEPSIQKIRERFNPDIESMEGAAVAFVCREFHIPCMQIRSISNRVEKRDKSKWEIEKAANALNQELIKLLSRFKC